MFFFLTPSSFILAEEEQRKGRIKKREEVTSGRELHFKSGRKKKQDKEKTVSRERENESRQQS